MKNCIKKRFGNTVHAQEAVMNNMTESVVYGFNGITKTAIVLGCIGIGVFVGTKLFATAKSWLNVKGILRVSFAVVAVITIAFVFTGAKEAAVTVTKSTNEMGMSASSTQSMSFLKLVASGEYDYVIISGSNPLTGETMKQIMSTDAWYEMDISGFMGINYEVEYVGDLLLTFSVFAQMFSIVVAILAAVALGKMLKNLWSEEKSRHLGISIVLLIFAVFYTIFAIVAKSKIVEINEVMAGGSTAFTAPVLPEVSVTPVILGAVFAVINLGMAIAQKVVDPKPVAPVDHYGYAPVYAAPQNYNNNNMSLGG